MLGLGRDRGCLLGCVCFILHPPVYQNTEVTGRGGPNPQRAEMGFRIRVRVRAWVSFRWVRRGRGSELCTGGVIHRVGFRLRLGLGLGSNLVTGFRLGHPGPRGVQMLLIKLLG